MSNETADVGMREICERDAGWVRGDGEAKPIDTESPKAADECEAPTIAPMSFGECFAACKAIATSGSMRLEVCAWHYDHTESGECFAAWQLWIGALAVHVYAPTPRALVDAVAARWALGKVDPPPRQMAEDVVIDAPAIVPSPSGNPSWG